MILGIIIAIIVVVTAIAVTATQLNKAKKSADKNFSNKCVGSSEEPCPLADLTVIVKNPNSDQSINFKNEIFVEHTGEKTLSKNKKCEQSHTFKKLKAGAYKVSAKPADNSGFHFDKPIDTTLAEGEKKTVTLTLEPLSIVQVTPTADVKQYVNLDADAAKPELGRIHKIQAKINKKQKGVTVYFEIEADAKNRKNLDAKLEAKIAKSSVTNDEGIAEIDFTLSRFGGDKFAVKACLTADLKHPSAGVVKSKEITVWRRLWYQLNHHKDIVPPSMATSVSKIKDVFIDFVAETPITHTKTAKGKVLIGSHNASTYHALRSSAHNDRSVHIILCDQQIDGTPGLTNEVEVEFDSNNDFIDATEKAGETYVMVDPPLQTGEKLFISGSWRNPHTGISGSLTYDATKTTDSIGLVKPNNEYFMEVILPKDAKPTVTKKVKVKIKVTVSSGPWGGDGGTAPHNLVVISSNDTEHTMCVLHELGHLMNMGPMAYSVKCPPGFDYTDHTKMYKSNGAHCYSGGTLVSGEGKDGTCIMYHQLNTKCTLEFCDLCAPFVKAQVLESFGDLKV